ncbi:hypothetical protein C8J57DRAFT_1240514 [Mycena rebaudengoi]|nr:hypothetical protein C8J57DRAFT_1240514 [Mycena rebaudengoi]
MFKFAPFCHCLSSTPEVLRVDDHILNIHGKIGLRAGPPKHDRLGIAAGEEVLSRMRRGVHTRDIRERPYPQRSVSVDLFGDGSGTDLDIEWQKARGFEPRFRGDYERDIVGVVFHDLRGRNVRKIVMPVSEVLGALQRKHTLA